MTQSLLTDFEQWWAIRITLDDVDLDKTYKLFDHYSKFIVSEEGGTDATKLHHHILLESDDTADQIKERIRVVYPLAKGNKAIYTKPSRDKRQLAKYTVKEGNYKYKGFTEQFITETFKCSKAKTDLRKQVTDNEDELILHKIEFNKFVENYINIKVKHDQPLYSNHIKAYCLKVGIRSGHYLARHYQESLVQQMDNEFRTM